MSKPSMAAMRVRAVEMQVEVVVDDDVVVVVVWQ